MKTISCPICGANSYFFDNYIDFFGHSVSLHKCIRCGHGSHDRQYTQEQFAHIYKADYAADYLSRETELYQKRQLQYALDVRLLLSSRRFRTARVLDYGCSSGGYLDAMPSEWVKSGYEVNPFHIEYLRVNKPHISAYDDLSALSGPFDLITLRGVVEHIAQHDELVAFLRGQLVPGGAVFITATPDFSSPAAALYKSRWNQVVCPEHIHQFSAASLSLLLARAGLVLRALSHPYEETPYADWSVDKAYFLHNAELAHNGGQAQQTAHAFPGTMLSALYEKADEPQ